MILLIAHLFMTSAMAQSNSPQGAPQTYCSEVQPQVVMPNDADVRDEDPNVPVAMSISIAAVCKDKTLDINDVCSMSARCTILPQAAIDHAKSAFNQDFSALDNATKLKVIQWVNLQDQNKLAADPAHFVPSFQWLPYELVCKKISLYNPDKSPYTSPSGNVRFCPLPDQCKLPNPKSNIQVKIAEFVPAQQDAMRVRLMQGQPTVFSPGVEAPPSAQPAAKATGQAPDSGTPPQ